MLSRREFLKNVGLAGGGLFLSASPWLSAFSQKEETMGNRARLGIIGPGSRGRFLMSFLAKNPKAEIAALCDIYQPSLDKALELAPNAKVYRDYRALLDDPTIDAVLVTTPLDRHYQMAMDVLDAGKHLFCEKALCYTIPECYEVYQKFKSGNRVFFIGQQRLFDPRYIKVMSMVHDGVFGEINAIRAYWYRNNDWRRPVPSPELERLINWRLYREHSKGLMTELACHQLQTGTWALKRIPDRVMGHGALTYWKDGREVDDNVTCIYIFDNGVKMTYDSVISNKFYGLEEKILGKKGTVEPEKGKFYFEEVEPAPAFMRLVSDIENTLFDAVPFAGTSWEPESADANTGYYILGKSPKTDGTSLMLDAFVEAVITGKQPKGIAEEAYYASTLCLLGYQAMEEGGMLSFPDAYKLNYLNHSNPHSL
ncbi:MAG TPA: Gfo/Idh/MocA family oxidoreductase [Candidatus Bacteroides merdavium]|uniref:Gfo/Idh/MocA family oxidoreductase n=1 Tax=Candidatus Bacteroides merdavium TaxID=2838472 RepID=A0A9D2H070_9BACE|nr:Gfo/Idh/MocA family oxidoreductase [Candidatus Bacteroides merdavium]